MESGSSSSASGSASSAILFEDIFDVEKLNPEGKKFDRVDRVVAKGETYETDLKLDLANELFSLRAGDKITFALASTLRPDGKPDSDYYDPQEGKVRTRTEGRTTGIAAEDEKATNPFHALLSCSLLLFVLCLQPSLLDSYDYGMCGKIFKYEHVGERTV